MLQGGKELSFSMISITNRIIYFALGQSRDLFRVTGALSYVRELLYSTSSTHVQQAALYTLGCAMEKNGMMQKISY